MSVSHNLITAVAVEEIQKWRCTKMNNNGEEEYRNRNQNQHDHDQNEHEHNSDSMSVLSCSGLTSPQQKQTPAKATYTAEGWSRNCCLSENNYGEFKTPHKNITPAGIQQHPRIFRKFFVRLAEESPKRNNSDELSDSSTYDSFNCRETDICRDSSDTESNSSFTSGEMGATIKVVEYEVATESNSEDLFTNDSSSGTDDFILAAVARAICNTSKCSSDFADTEEESSEADSTYDSEFSLADYWVCVKCKNKKNNPMFRYCEKCYQIRKTHFPPRPRLRKSRTAVKEHRRALGASSLRPSGTSEGITNSMAMNKQQSDNLSSPSASMTSSSKYSLPKSSSSNICGRLGVKRSHDELVSEFNSDDDNNASQLSENTNNTMEKRTKSEEIPYSQYLSPLLRVEKPIQKLQTVAKRKLSKNKYKEFSKRKCYNHNSELNSTSSSSSSSSEIETDIVLSQTICVNSQQNSQKDSGFSSAPSSQDRNTLSDHPIVDEIKERITNCGDDNAHNSDDTVCDELSDCDVAEMSMSQDRNRIPSTLEFDLNSQESSIGRHASDISMQISSESQHVIPTLVQSVSECSDAYTNVKQSMSNSELPKMSAIKEKLRFQESKENGNGNSNCDFPSYGTCMTCLTEPKNGVFVHSKFLHLCCCYKCAVKIWNKNKKCPICNCAVKNVMKLFVH